MAFPPLLDDVSDFRFQQRLLTPLPASFIVREAEEVKPCPAWL